MQTSKGPLHSILDDTSAALERFSRNRAANLEPEEIGWVTFVGNGVARVRGLPHIQAGELARFPGDCLGLVFNLDPDEVGVVLLDKAENLAAGDEARR
ncbi:MAG: hypothetical protein N2C14_28425, partial [Planctomycetales bacterium]